MAALPHCPCGNAHLPWLSEGEQLTSIWCCCIWHFKSKQKWGEELRFSEEEWHEEEEREGWLVWGSHPPKPLEPSRDVELLRLWIIWGAWLEGSPGCLVCVLWVLATRRVWCGGCRVMVVGLCGVSEAVRLTQQPWGFPWLFSVAPDPSFSFCSAFAKDKFQLHW